MQGSLHCEQAILLDTSSESSLLALKSGMVTWMYSLQIVLCLVSSYEQKFEFSHRVLKGYRQRLISASRSFFPGKVFGKKNRNESLKA